MFFWALGQIERCQDFPRSFISDLKLCFDLVVFFISYPCFEGLCFSKCIQPFLDLGAQALRSLLLCLSSRSFYRIDVVCKSAVDVVHYTFCFSVNLRSTWTKGRFCFFFQLFKIRGWNVCWVVCMVRGQELCSVNIPYLTFYPVPMQN